jgi:hypothetical protein
MAVDMTVGAEAGQVTPSAVRLWVGRVFTALAVLFLLFDGVAKVMKVVPVIEASARLGIPGHVIPGLGALLIAATLIYAFPRTSPLGAILLTGYLGGAICAHVRAGDPAFPTVFPAIVAAIAWGGLYLREPRLGMLIPVRQ